MKFLHSAALAASLALFALAGCKQETSAPEARPSDKPGVAMLTPGNAGLSASDGKLVLPAVKGRPGAAYFMVSNSGTKPMTLTGMAIEGAGKTEMHETKGGEMAPLASAEIRAGDMIMFERGGKHVMAFDLPASIAPGGTAKGTLTFADGTRLPIPLAVEAAGGGGAMDHGAMH